MAIRYKQAVKELYTKNQKLIDEFNKLALGTTEFDAVGRQLQTIVRQAEHYLCGKMEGSGHGSYSANLADKFYAELKTIIPNYYLIGVEIS
jgi:hypothetical protein